MMGRQVAPELLFYELLLDDHVPANHLLRQIDVFIDLESIRPDLQPFYSQISRPSVDPELMIRMLIIAYLEQGQPDKAIEDLDRTLLAYPNDPKPITNAPKLISSQATPTGRAMT